MSTERYRRFSLRRAVGGLFGCVAACLVSAAPAQSTTLELGDDGAWVQTRTPEPGSAEGRIAEIRRELALGNARRARSLAGDLVDDLEPDDPWFASALLLRGDAKAAMGREFQALYDYEEVINRFPAAPEYRQAVERELRIGLEYARGKRRRVFWGLARIGSSGKLAQELLIRVQERLPGSDAAERAGIELADYYFRIRDMRMASEAYDVFTINHPQSVHRRRAMQRRILANVARFKGPRYDASGLVEAGALIEDFRDRYPLRAQDAGLSDALEARLDESIGAQILENARWYLRTGDEVSARFTLRRLVAKHPRSVAAERARQMLTERGWQIPARAEEDDGLESGGADESRSEPSGDAGGRGDAAGDDPQGVEAGSRETEQGEIGADDGDGR